MKLPHLIVPFLAALMASSVHAQTTFLIDFDNDDQGNALMAGAVNLATNEPYRNLFSTGVGVRLSTGKPSTEPLNLYDTEGTGGKDNDLERNSEPIANPGAYAGGSHPTFNYGNVLIINTDNNLATPNDEANGGFIALNFDVSLVNFGFDFIDLDSANNGSITFLDVSSGNQRTVAFADFEDVVGAPFRRTDVTFGDRHANRVLNISAADLGLTSFDEVKFNLLSSGGIGTIYGTTAFTQVPEPSMPAILAGSIAILGILRRR